MARIFLSYSHKDNAAPPAGGWIHDFHQRLQDQLAIASGVFHEIWLDRHDYRQNNRLAQILSDAAQASVFVAMVGPLHANSTWCKDELVTFLGRNPSFPRPAATATRDLSSVFVVSKYPLPNQQEPLRFVLEQILPDDDPLLGRLEQNVPYEFHEAGPPPRTYHPERPTDYAYHDMLNKLAFHLSVALANKTKVVLFGAPKSTLLSAVRKSVSDYGYCPPNGRWPDAQSPREEAIRSALEECALAVVALEPDAPADCWQWLDRAVAHPKLRRCMLWLDDAQPGLDAARFAGLRAKPPDKCELYESKSFLKAQFVQAVRDNLAFLEKNPPLPLQPRPPPGGAARRRVHVVYRSEDQHLANLAFQDAMERNVQTVDVRFTSLEALNEHANSAEAILIASSSEETATPLMRRVAARLNTDQRAGVGFLAQAPLLEGNFRWLGRSVPGIFAQFPD